VYPFIFPDRSTLPERKTDPKACPDVRPFRRISLEDTALAKIKRAETTLTIDQRKAANRRATPDRRSSNATAVTTERRIGQRRAKVSRRRQIDPTTCERDYTQAEIEFMHAMDQYKRASGRMFPTCSEVLEVLLSLGYEKKAGAEKKPAGIEMAAACGASEVEADC
jgi:hypothetical protein